MSVKPEKTLAIILGASKFPNMNSLEENNAFKNSATAFKKYLVDVFGIPKQNLLYLFNANYLLTTVDSKIANFISKNSDISDLLFYYVGHGGFAISADEGSYYLTLYSTRTDQELTSGYSAKAIAKTFTVNASHIRKYLILDCCFSAVCYESFQSTPITIATRKMEEAFEYPNKGTSLLCAANKYEPAITQPGDKYTMFSTALLEILNDGNESYNSYFSFEDIGTLIQQRIKESFKDKAVRPEVLSPDQKCGDIKKIPFFPNLKIRETAQNNSKLIDDTQNPFEEVINVFKLNKISITQYEKVLEILERDILTKLVSKCCHDSTKYNSMTTQLKILIGKINDYKNNSGSHLLLQIKYDLAQLESSWISIKPSPSKSMDTKKSQNNPIQEDLRYNLIQKVAECPCMTWARIENVIGRLPKNISRQITYSNVLSDYIENIVKKALDFHDGLTKLFDAIKQSDEGTEQFIALENFIINNRLNSYFVDN